MQGQPQLDLPEPYAATADVYDRLVDYAITQWGESPRQQMADFVEDVWVERAQRVRRVLELCCGTGLMTRQLVERGYEVTAVDRSETMLALARERLGDRADFRRIELPDALPEGPTRWCAPPRPSTTSPTRRPSARPSAPWRRCCRPAGSSSSTSRPPPSSRGTGATACGPGTRVTWRSSGTSPASPTPPTAICTTRSSPGRATAPTRGPVRCTGSTRSRTTTSAPRPTPPGSPTPGSTRTTRPDRSASPPATRPGCSPARERSDPMLVCGLKLTHDGGLALIEDGRLVTSVEAEKLDNNRRFQPLDRLETVADVLAAEGVAVTDVDRFVVDGWFAPSARTRTPPSWST
ncbi:methyltransferase domain-containing protein [Nocardiopsis eucommiae]|uniref:Methyltransferase domain-containing protein n=1 Tax=Nocardiopsis eucommiae TaxID=2831970 RepID=A0A975QLY2_9ACTN|nr:methyltransferase domain-containing protein [Nocardiopsis eucommiae]